MVHPRKDKSRYLLDDPRSKCFTNNCVICLLRKDLFLRASSPYLDKVRICFGQISCSAGC